MNRKSLPEYVISSAIPKELRFSYQLSSKPLTLPNSVKQIVTKLYGDIHLQRYPSTEISNTVIASTDKRIDNPVWVPLKVPIKGHNQQNPVKTYATWGRATPFWRKKPLRVRKERQSSLPYTIIHDDFPYVHAGALALRRFPIRFSAASTLTLRMVEKRKKRPIQNLIRNGIDVPPECGKKEQKVQN